MAINPSVKYAGNVTAPDADYPLGSARNVSAPGAGDGTPLEQDWVNDWFGFQQAVLSEAGITASGVPDTAVVSQLFEAMRAIFGSVNWRGADIVGTSLTPTGGNFTAICSLTSTLVATYNSSAGELQAYEFDVIAETWSAAGSPLAIASSARNSLCRLSDTSVAFVDGTNDELRKYDFDGTNWTLDGAGLSITGLTAPAICSLSATRIVLFDVSITGIRAYDFDGSVWAQVGNTLSGIVGAPRSGDIESISASRVVLYDSDGSTAGQFRVYDFDGTDFTVFGSAFVLGNTGVGSIAALGGNDWAFLDPQADTLSVYRLSGSTISLASYETPVSGISGAMTAMNGADVAVFGFSTLSISTYRFDFWVGQGPFRV